MEHKIYFLMFLWGIVSTGFYLVCVYLNFKHDTVVKGTLPWLVIMALSWSAVYLAS